MSSEEHLENCVADEIKEATIVDIDDIFAILSSQNYLMERSSLEKLILRSVVQMPLKRFSQNYTSMKKLHDQ